MRRDGGLYACFAVLHNESILRRNTCFAEGLQKNIRGRFSVGNLRRIGKRVKVLYNTILPKNRQGTFLQTGRGK